MNLNDVIAVSPVFRPRFFSPAEWRYHLLMMPLLFPLGNYYFIGTEYFRILSVFLLGTVVVFGLYWLSIVLLTLAVRKATAHISDRFTLKRFLLMLFVVGLLTSLLAVFDVWVYSLVPGLKIPFSWQKVQPIWILGCVFDLFICAALSLFYSYSRWKAEQLQHPQAIPASLSPAASARLSINYQGWWSGVSPLEWGFHGLALLVFVPLANALLIGPRYWSDRSVLAIGSAIVVMLYMPCAVLLTFSVRFAIRTFPHLRQTVYRVFLMLVLTGLVSSIAALGAIGILTQIDILQITYSSKAAKSLVLLGLCFDFLLCLAHGYFYALSMWQQEQLENETLQNEALQRRYDTLKGQVNPHFLFNSLTSLSSLIQENPKQAEKFVDELSKVYRYLLHSHHAQLTSLAKEITFLNSYVFLLKIRYGSGISVSIDAAIYEKTGYLPPLALQSLLENAMKNNIISTKSPLTVHIEATADEHLKFKHTLRKKKMSIVSAQTELPDIVGKYTLLTPQPVTLFDDGEEFSILLPLLSNQTVAEEI
ncbi:MAG: histidine kinase [Spirosomataceae bacterium]